MVKFAAEMVPRARKIPRTVSDLSNSVEQLMKAVRLDLEIRILGIEVGAEGQMGEALVNTVVEVCSAKKTTRQQPQRSAKVGRCIGSVVVVHYDARKGSRDWTLMFP